MEFEDTYTDASSRAFHLQYENQRMRNEYGDMKENKVMKGVKATTPLSILAFIDAHCLNASLRQGQDLGDGRVHRANKEVDKAKLQGDGYSKQIFNKLQPRSLTPKLSSGESASPHWPAQTHGHFSFIGGVAVAERRHWQSKSLLLVTLLKHLPEMSDGTMWGISVPNGKGNIHLNCQFSILSIYVRLWEKFYKTKKKISIFEAYS